jgi:hypothetical protein
MDLARALTIYRLLWHEDIDEESRRFSYALYKQITIGPARPRGVLLLILKSFLFLFVVFCYYLSFCSDYPKEKTPASIARFKTWRDISNYTMNEAIDEYLAAIRTLLKK